LVAQEWNATKRPSALMEGTQVLPFPCSPALLTLTRSVKPVCLSRTKTSPESFVSPGTRLVASDPKATERPSALMVTPWE
jgi:hypothetical protein